MQKFDLVSKYIGTPTIDITAYEREEGMLDLIHRLIEIQNKTVAPWNVLWCVSRSTLQPKERFAAVVYGGFRRGYFELKEIDDDGEKTLGIGLAVECAKFYGS